MKAWRWLSLGVLGLVVASAAAVLVDVPGYMDADYYFATARELAEGRIWTEPFLWNYLDNPAGLPHPAHLYWSPLASLLAAAFMLVFGRTFAVAQLPFTLIAAGLPLVTAAIARWQGAEEPRAWLAGCLAAFPGFYLPFLVSTDTFGVYAVLGSSALWAMAAAPRRGQAFWLIAGGLIGLCGLTRADGPILLVPGLAATLRAGRARVRAGAGLLLGFALVMLPWWLRNASAAGSFWPPGAGLTLWSVRYDDLFAYPASLLTPERWLASGWQAIAGARLEALGANLQTLLGVNGLVFLAPLMAIGAWVRRDQPLVRLTGLYLLTLLAVMTLVFPFAGSRGGLFHSGSAVMPILWPLATDGLHEFIGWGVHRRSWHPRRAFRAFGAGAVALAAGVTLGLTWSRLVGPDGNRLWGASHRAYSALGHVLADEGAEDGLVAVNNPPGFWLATGWQAVVIPDGPPQVLEAVVARYGVTWVVLERNHPRGLEGMYADPGSVTWLTPVASLTDTDGYPVRLLRVGTPAEAAP